MKLFDKIMQSIRNSDRMSRPDLLIISKKQERQLYLDDSIPKATDVADAFDIEVMVVEELDRYRLMKELKEQ